MSHSQSGDFAGKFSMWNSSHPHNMCSGLAVWSLACLLCVPMCFITVIELPEVQQSAVKIQCLNLLTLGVQILHENSHLLALPPPSLPVNYSVTQSHTKRVRSLVLCKPLCFGLQTSVYSVIIIFHSDKEVKPSSAAGFGSSTWFSGSILMLYCSKY